MKNRILDALDFIAIGALGSVLLFAVFASDETLCALHILLLGA